MGALSWVLFHGCSFMGALSWVLSHGCSLMGALSCVLHLASINAQVDRIERVR